MKYLPGDVYHSDYIYGSSSTHVRGWVFTLFVEGDIYKTEYYNYQIFPTKWEAEAAMYMACST